MTTCGMCRWHPFLRASAPSKPCILATGHDGLCRDGWGGQFTGSVPRAEALDPADVDAMNEDAMPADPREDVPDAERADVPAARVDALMNELGAILANPGHPAHAYARLRQADHRFDRLDAHMRTGGALPSAWRVTVGDTEDVTTLYDETSSALRTRGNVVAAWKALHAAREAWTALDEALRDGSPLPSPWARRRL